MCKNRLSQGPDTFLADLRQLLKDERVSPLPGNDIGTCCLICRNKTSEGLMSELTPEHNEISKHLAAATAAGLDVAKFLQLIQWAQKNLPIIVALGTELVAIFTKEPTPA